MSVAEAVCCSACFRSAGCAWPDSKHPQPLPAAAWQHHRVRVVCGDLAQAPFPQGSCGVLTMFHVVEHLPDPVSYLKSARELLAPDGRLIIQVPNASCWQFMLFGSHWNGVDVPRHLMDYRERDLERLLDQCGFDIVRRKHFSLRDNPAGLASSLAPGLVPWRGAFAKYRNRTIGKLSKAPALLRPGGCRAAIHAARSCLRCWVDHHGGGAQESLSYRTIERRLPGNFCGAICCISNPRFRRLSRNFRSGLPPDARVLDAGAGEMPHVKDFTGQRYVGVDLAVGVRLGIRQTGCNWRPDGVALSLMRVSTPASISRRWNMFESRPVRCGKSRGCSHRAGAYC